MNNSHVELLPIRQQEVLVGEAIYLNRLARETHPSSFTCVLCSAQPGMINKRTECGETALMLAVSKEQLRCIQLLLNSGADPDTANYDKETPLYKGKPTGSDG